MQTFLPYPSFTRSLACLDNRRLGKQRVEAKQILMALEFGPYQFYHPTASNWISCDESAFKSKLGHGRYRRTPWYNHPATKMWSGHEKALALYGLRACITWLSRDFRDSLLPWFANRYINIPGTDTPPPFSEAFHLSHQSNLVRKDPAYYRKFFLDVPDNLPYVWPVP